MARQRSLGGPLILIGLGVLLLYSSLRANWTPWEVIWRYWPILLIAWGLGKLWDHLRYREQPGVAPPAVFSGGEVALLAALVVLVALAFAHRHQPFYVRRAPENYRSTQSVELRGAQVVHARIELAAGRLDIAGGSPTLLNANFTYSLPSLKPDVDYQVSGGEGELDIRQPQVHHVHFGNAGRNQWDLHFSNQAPLDLNIQMGAGQGRLQLGGLTLTHFSVEGGAGNLWVDLTGANWKKNLDGRIEGGVGTVTVRLPRDVGVRVRATGGLGSVRAPGLTRDGDTYTNGVYGKSPVTVDLDIEGGVGAINLQPGL